MSADTLTVRINAAACLTPAETLERLGVETLREIYTQTVEERKIIAGWDDPTNLLPLVDAFIARLVVVGARLAARPVRRGYITGSTMNQMLRNMHRSDCE